MIIISPTNEDYARISQENINAWVIKNPERAPELGIKIYALSEEERKIRKRECDRKRREANPERTKENRRKYREANVEKAKESVRKWRETNVEKAKESVRKWREANPEKVREYKRKYYEANREKVIERSRKWHEANPEKAREIRRKWYKTNPEKAREMEAKSKKRTVLIRKLRDQSRQSIKAPKHVGACRTKVLPLSASESIFFQMVSAVNQTQNFAQQLVTQ